MGYHKNSFVSEINNATATNKPVFELSDQQVEQFKTASAYVLGVVGVLGVVAVAAVAPNLVGAIYKIHKTFKKKKPLFQQRQKAVAETFFYLKRHGFIDISKTEKGFFANITEKGKKRLLKLTMDNVFVPKRQKWDGKWWLVAADVPTKKYRAGADSLRRKIKQMGLFPLQRTMWFYPFDPSAQIEYIANHFGIGNFVTVMEVSRLDKEDEKKLKDFFKI